MSCDSKLPVEPSKLFVKIPDDRNSINQLILRNCHEDVIIPYDLLPESMKDKVNVDAVTAVKHLVSLVKNYKKQIDWIAKYMQNSERVPCPYSAGCFDQTKKCPYWTSYSGDWPEDDSRDAWYEILMDPTDFGDDVDCGTSLSFCLKKAAEEAVRDEDA